jgi:glycogen debranching enzyme
MKRALLLPLDPIVVCAFTSDVWESNTVLIVMLLPELHVVPSRSLGPLALVEVQGYAYRALLGAAELAAVVDIGHDAGDLRRLAEALKDRFNDLFWDRRGWFALGLDGDGRRVDSLTTNPGHALWSGIADDDKARAYVERLVGADLWTGWGLRTLASPMAA